MNGEIRDREIRVISETGEMLGVMSPREAMRLAEEAGLDLVKISPNAVPPVLAYHIASRIQSLWQRYFI